MPEQWRSLLLRCDVCATVVERSVRCHDARLDGSPAFVPQRCSGCWAHAAEPTIRPYVLTRDDRAFLLDLWIQPE